MVTREQVVATARGYVGTPFRHQGRARGRAVDCVGLVLCVAEDLNLVDVHGRAFMRADYRNYGPQAVDAMVHDECSRRMVCRWPLGAVQGSALPVLRPGDVVTLRVPSVPCHVAIVTNLEGAPGMVHAYAGAGKVAENRLDEKWERRIAGVFALPGVVG